MYETKDHQTFNSAQHKTFLKKMVLLKTVNEYIFLDKFRRLSHGSVIFRDSDIAMQINSLGKNRSNFRKGNKEKLH